MGKESLRLLPSLLPKEMPPVRRVTTQALDAEGKVLPMPTQETPYAIIEEEGTNVTHIARGFHYPNEEPATIIEFPKLDYTVFEQ